VAAEGAEHKAPQPRAVAVDAAMAKKSGGRRSKTGTSGEWTTTDFRGSSARGRLARHALAIEIPDWSQRSQKQCPQGPGRGTRRKTQGERQLTRIQKRAKAFFSR
jgi:hypothetical protein